MRGKRFLAVIIFSWPYRFFLLTSRGKFSFRAAVSAKRKNQSHCAKRLVRATVGLAGAAKSDLIAPLVSISACSAEEQNFVVGKINGQGDCSFAL